MCYLEKIALFNLSCQATSNTSLMVNRGKGYTQYANSNLGMIGIEVEPVKDTKIWAESGKSYAELTCRGYESCFRKTQSRC